MLSNKFQRLNNKDILSIKDVCGYTYEKCKPYFNQTRIALDIGCKAGHFAKHMCKDFQYVHMFDMRPKMKWQHLDRNRCLLHRVAVGNVNGKIKYSGAVTNHVSDKEEQEAELRTIDSFNFANVDFIKIDVEGDEKSVLEGAFETLEKWKPVVVLEQNHVTEKYGKGQYGDAVRWLEQNNYKITNYDGMDDWIMTHV